MVRRTSTGVRRAPRSFLAFARSVRLAIIVRHAPTPRRVQRSSPLAARVPRRRHAGARHLGGEGRATQRPADHPGAHHRRNGSLDGDVSSPVRGRPLGGDTDDQGPVRRHLQGVVRRRTGGGVLDRFERSPRQWSRHAWRSRQAPRARNGRRDGRRGGAHQPAGTAQAARPSCRQGSERGSAFDRASEACGRASRSTATST